MATIDVRTGQAPPAHTREEFRALFRARFLDPAFRAEDAAIDRLEAIAWDGYCQARKSPLKRKAGPEFKDPDYDMSVEWYDTRNRLIAAQQKWGERATASRVLVINGSNRNDGTCPGEMSKSFRLSQIAIETLRSAGMQTDLLDLSRLVSDYDRHIHPCKACVSTAMPLCHWPCSCYPNHELSQVNDWMAEIYERWVSAHGIVLVTPTHWYTMSSPLKLMIDRLVCADGGNPDLSSTHGKDPRIAKQLELDGWPYPKHLAGRTYGVVVHGDVAGIEGTRRALCDWLDWMGLIDAGVQSRLDRYIGYYEPYATSHQTLDADTKVQEEVRNVARAVAEAVGELREGRLSAPDRGLQRPRPK
jgi:multimeric flavodoxin WrbA